MTLLHDRQLRIENIANEVRIHAVDDHAETRAEERILDLLRLALEGEDTLTARNLRQLDELLHKLPLLLELRDLTGFLDQFGKVSQLFHPKSDEQTRKRAADDDQERRRVVECRQRCSLQNHTNKDRDHAHDKPDDC